MSQPARVELVPGDIVMFQTPDRMQGRTGKMMQELAALSDMPPPEYVMDALSAGSLRAPYDFNRHISTRRVALARATKMIGWDARHAFVEEASEYYFHHRRLEYEAFMAELREEAVRGLNKILARVGRRLGFEAAVTVGTLPTAKTVQDAQSRLAKGEGSFRDIMEPFTRHL
jgi:hypothetical protein